MKTDISLVNSPFPAYIGMSVMSRVPGGIPVQSRQTRPGAPARTCWDGREMQWNGQCQRRPLCRRSHRVQDGPSAASFG